MNKLTFQSQSNLFDIGMRQITPVDDSKALVSLFDVYVNDYKSRNKFPSMSGQHKSPKSDFLNFSFEAREKIFRELKFSEMTNAKKIRSYRWNLKNATYVPSQLQNNFILFSHNTHPLLMSYLCTYFYLPRPFYIQSSRGPIISR